MATKSDETPVERYADSLALPDMEGDIEALPLYAGQSTGLVGTAPSAGEVVETLVEEAHAALARTDTLRGGDGS